MKERKRKLPSAAMIVAVLALVAGVTGTAIAGPDAFTSVSKKKTKSIANKQAKKQINKRTPWTGNDIADGAISTSKLSEGAVSTSKLSDESVKAEQLGEINQVTATQTIPQQQTGTASVQCDNDEKVISGGFDGVANAQFAGPIILTHVDKRNNNGWTATASNFGDAPGQLIVYAYCLEAAS